MFPSQALNTTDWATIKPILLPLIDDTVALAVAAAPNISTYEVCKTRLIARFGKTEG